MTQKKEARPSSHNILYAAKTIESVNSPLMPTNQLGKVFKLFIHETLGNNVETKISGQILTQNMLLVLHFNQFKLKC